MQGGPYVVAVVSEKGGVGKTTIATNLAVYLKAMEEDLPVTIASFDNHFTVEQMFALGPLGGGCTAAGLFGDASVALEVCLGEYGVQYLPSARQLEPPDASPDRLLRSLPASGLSGILILDTRPLLDYFTRNAMRAADLILAPVKDRASLVNVASILRTLEEDGGSPERLWVVPSLIDKRLKLRGEVGMESFLACSAAERGYRVIEPGVAKSPKVEGLGTGFSSRVYPVLTHARSTVVHRQFASLARFVRERLQRCGMPNHRSGLPAAVMAQSPPGRLRNLAVVCPVCGGAAAGEAGHFFFDLRSRRRGFIHPDCGRELLEKTELEIPWDAAAALALVVGEGRREDGAPTVHLHLFDRRGEELGTASPLSVGTPPWGPFLGRARGRDRLERRRTLILVTLEGGAPVRFLADPAFGVFTRLRGRILRELTDLYR